MQYDIIDEDLFAQEYPEPDDVALREIAFTTTPFFTSFPHARTYDDVPLAVGIEVANEVSRACEYFYNPQHIYMGDPEAPAFTEEQVKLVITGLQKQLTKEGISRTRTDVICYRHNVHHEHYFILEDLPMTRQRALVENIWAIKQRWGGKVNVWYTDDQPARLDGSITPTGENSESVYGFRVYHVEVIDNVKYIGLEHGAADQGTTYHYRLNAMLSVYTQEDATPIGFVDINNTTITGARRITWESPSTLILYTMVYGRHVTLFVTPLDEAPEGWTATPGERNFFDELGYAGGFGLYYW